MFLAPAWCLHFSTMALPSSMEVGGSIEPFGQTGTWMSHVSVITRWIVLAGGGKLTVFCKGLPTVGRGDPWRTRRKRGRNWPLGRLESLARGGVRRGGNVQYTLEGRFGVDAIAVVEP